ncbi:unnamed protein product [Ectocarpus sp. 6 AP-2014]
MAAASSSTGTTCTEPEHAGRATEEDSAIMTSRPFSRDVSEEAPMPLGRRLLRAFSQGINPASSIRTLKGLSNTSRSSSGDTENLTPPPARNAVGPNSMLWTLSEASSLGEEAGWETIVGQDGIKPAMGLTSFHSEKHGLRLWVQPDSVPVPLSPGRQEASGPIRVRDLVQTVDFEGGELQGVLEVECLPCGRRFDAPLLLDFPVDGRNKEDPIIDAHGRIQYEILFKDSHSEKWVRDPESSIPPEIVQDNQGKVYVRAHVRHFSCWGFFFKPLAIGPQLFQEQTIPWVQSKRHQSLIQNNTPGGVDIHIYAMRMSQWSAALESVKAGVGVEGFQANFEFTGDVRQNVNPAALVPQMVTIPSGHSHWIEVPRVGAGFRSSRKAVVMIVTEFNDENDGKRMRLETVEHLRSRTMLTVALRVSEEGKVIGSPVASEAGGILSQLMRAIQNDVNATPNNAPSTAARSRSETNSGVNIGLGAERPGAEQFVGSPAMAESSGDDISPTGAGPADDAAAMAASTTRSAGDDAAAVTGAGPADDAAYDATSTTRSAGDDAAAVTAPTAVPAEAAAPAAAAVSVAAVPKDREPPAAKAAVDDPWAGARSDAHPNASPFPATKSAATVSPVA